MYAGKGRGGVGIENLDILRLTLAVAESYRNIDYRLPFD